MAAETDVQFFSHLNSGCPQLTNDWGCMISLLDACLVNGVSLPTVSSVTVATGGNITVNFVAAHSVLLFQCVTLAGFTPDALNGKYRVIGVPSTTQLTLSSDLSAQSATAIGTAKLSPLGYQIVYSANTKRVYRALNPTANHPYIRVDESTGTSDGTGIYADAYAKYAMVGLLASIDSIDDYENDDVLQLPFNPSNLSKNWDIVGQNADCVRGWSRWYWTKAARVGDNAANTVAPPSGARPFTLVGNADAFYLLNSQYSASDTYKKLSGCGLIDGALPNDIVPNWFLATTLTDEAASASIGHWSLTGGVPLGYNANASAVFLPTYSENTLLQAHTVGYCITPDYRTGDSALYSANNISALQVPVADANKYLRGTLKHVYYAGNNRDEDVTTPILADTSMYLWDCCYTVNATGGMFFYLGEMS